MNELGHEFINRSFIVDTTTYLYAAARAVSEQYGDEQEFPLWDDMETFLDSFIDESALLKGIYESSDDPAKIIKNIKAIMPADVLDPKPDNCPLDEGSDRHEEFKNAVRVRQLLSKRYTSSDGKNPVFMEYIQDLVRERMGHVVEKLRPEDDTSMLLRDISTDKYGGQPHSHSLGQLPKEQHEQSLKRLELKQKHQRRKVMLAQLSPIQQLQFLANIVEEQHEDLLALDSMALFHTSWYLVYAVAMTHQQWLNDECGITVNPTRSFVERAAIVPVVIGDHLTGDVDGDKKLLRRLARDVRMVLEKDEGTLCGPLAYESDLIEDRTRRILREHTNNQ
ncbi:hypothetical protein F5883DRAFT_681364 [Diaporthe sp. PMI_573]|nr:hypothetical protein F5883DRAFT_681364 [Diaporthaceae sp. PMI_573]